MSSGVEPAVGLESAVEPGAAHVIGAVHMDTMFLCTVLLLSGIVPGVAFFSLLVAPFAALWLAWQFGMTALKTRRWSVLRIKVLALAATIGVLFTSQAIYEPLARHAADEARQAVLAWHSARGQWPRTIEEAGFGDAARMKRWRVRYLGDGLVMYSSTFDGFDRWVRRPEDPEWIFRPD